MVSGLLTEFFSAPEYAGKIKNMSDAVKMAMSTLNGAEAGNATMHQKTEKAQPYGCAFWWTNLRTIRTNVIFTF